MNPRGCGRSGCGTSVLDVHLDVYIRSWSHPELIDSSEVPQTLA